MRLKWILYLMLVLAAAGCRSSGPPPDVILITVDTLRADHLSCYGYWRPTSPAVDALAADGAVFERVVASSAYTGPSVASIMTGYFPRFSTFGYRNKGAYLSTDETTLAEIFQDAGYDTAAFIGNPLLARKKGFAQGFALYDEKMTEIESTRSYMKERTAPNTAAVVTDWLDKPPSGKPVFLWVHFQDPHGPYTPPEDLAETFSFNDRGRMIPACPEENNSGKGCVPWYQCTEDTHFMNEYLARYDAEIAYMDRYCGEIFDALKRTGRYQDSVIIFTSDHGEALGENDFYFRHGHAVTRDQSAVPLILKHPRIPGGTRVDTPVGHVDIFSTFDHILTDGEGSRSTVNGISLLELTSGSEPDRALYCDTGSYLGVHKGSHLLIGRLKSNRAADIAALTAGDFKPVFFGDYWQNPYRGINAPGPARALMAEAGTYISQPPAVKGTMKPDAHLTRELKALGYVDGP